MPQHLQVSLSSCRSLATARKVSLQERQEGRARLGCSIVLPGGRGVLQLLLQQRLGCWVSTEAPRSWRQLVALHWQIFLASSTSSCLPRSRVTSSPWVTGRLVKRARRSCPDTSHTSATAQGEQECEASLQQYKCQVTQLSAPLIMPTCGYTPCQRSL